MKCLLLPRWMSRKPGFTLFECSLVIMLVTLVMFLSGSHGSFLHRLLVRCELEHLYTTCYYLQKKAMMSQKPQKLVFEPNTNSYRYGMTRHTLPAHVKFGSLFGAQGPPANPSKQITNPITFKNNSISFAPTGVIQSGTVYLTDSSYEHGYALSCGVAQVSYLRKYQYSDTWHGL